MLKQGQTFALGNENWKVAHVNFSRAHCVRTDVKQVTIVDKITGESKTFDAQVGRTLDISADSDIEFLSALKAKPTHPVEVIPAAEPLMKALFEPEATTDMAGKLQAAIGAMRRGHRFILENETPKVAPVTDDAARAARIERSRQWHIKDKAKKAAAKS